MPALRHSERRRRVAFPSREPISRFVASSFEVLERLLNRISAGGQRMPDEMYTEPSGPLSRSVLSRGTRWYAPLMSVLNSTSRIERDSALYALVDGFVEDTECGIAYSAAEHFATQHSFITSGHAERSHLDFQIRLSNASTDLERLRRRISYAHPSVLHKTEQSHALPSAAAGNGSIAWKCALGRENDEASKARLAISKDDFVAVLRRHPALTQRLCTVYIQDFLCFGFPLPLECEGGRELAWLPRSSSVTVDSSSSSVATEGLAGRRSRSEARERKGDAA